MPDIIYSAILTPDGTLLESRHRHDYKEYVDANGETYLIDGGCNYVRSSVNKEPAEFIQLTEKDPIEVIREYWNWGSYGPSGDQPLHYVLLKDMEEDHMKAILDNCTTRWEDLFKREIEYRKENNND